MAELPSKPPSSIAEILDRYGLLSRNNLYQLCKTLGITGVNEKTRKSLYLAKIAQHYKIQCDASNFESAPKARSTTQPHNPPISENKKLPQNISTIIHFSDINFTDINRIPEYEKIIDQTLLNIISRNLPWKETIGIITGIKSDNINQQLIQLTEKFIRLLYIHCGAGIFTFVNQQFPFADKTHIINSSQIIDLGNINIYFNSNIDASQKFHLNIAFDDTPQHNVFDFTIGGEKLTSSAKSFNPGSPIQHSFAESPQRTYAIYTIDNRNILVSKCFIPNPSARLTLEPKTSDELIASLQNISTIYESPHLKISSQFKITEDEVRKLIPGAKSINITISEIQLNIPDDPDLPKKHWNIENITYQNNSYTIPDGISKSTLENFPQIINYITFKDTREINKSKNILHFNKYQSTLQSPCEKITINTISSGKKWTKKIFEDQLPVKSLHENYKLFDLIYIPDLTKKENRSIKKLGDIISYAETSDNFDLKIDEMKSGKTDNPETIKTIINLQNTQSTIFNTIIQNTCNEIIFPLTKLTVKISGKIEIFDNNIKKNLQELNDDEIFIIHYALRIAIISSSKKMIPKTLIIDHPITVNLFKITSDNAKYHSKIIITSISDSITIPAITPVIVDL